MPGLVVFFFFFWLCSVLIAVMGPHCCAWAFSSWGEQGLFSSCGARASHCGGFSCGARALKHKGLVVVALRLSCPAARGIFPDQGSNPWLLQLAGRFFTTEPPGNWSSIIFYLLTSFPLRPWGTPFPHTRACLPLCLLPFFPVGRGPPSPGVVHISCKKGLVMQSCGRFLMITSPSSE